MYILDLEIAITEIEISQDYNIALLKGHLSTLILLDLSEHLKLFITCHFELLLFSSAFPSSSPFTAVSKTRIS